MRWSRTKWNWLIFGGSPVLLAVVAVLGFLGYGKLLNRRAHMAWKAAGMISSPEELAEFCPPPAGPETDELDWLASQLAEAGIRDAWDPGDRFSIPPPEDIAKLQQVLENAAVLQPVWDRLSSTERFFGICDLAESDRRSNALIDISIWQRLLATEAIYHNRPAILAKALDSLRKLSTFADWGIEFEGWQISGYCLLVEMANNCGVADEAILTEALSSCRQWESKLAAIQEIDFQVNTYLDRRSCEEEPLQYPWRLHGPSVRLFFEQYLWRNYDLAALRNYLAQVKSLISLEYYQGNTKLRALEDEYCSEYHYVTRETAWAYRWRWFENYSSHLARLRTARAGIAVELYRRRHGAWPESLEQLVPEFLDAVPVDPFTGKALEYCRMQLRSINGQMYPAEASVEIVRRKPMGIMEIMGAGRMPLNEIGEEDALEDDEAAYDFRPEIYDYWVYLPEEEELRDINFWITVISSTGKDGVLAAIPDELQTADWKRTGGDINFYLLEEKITSSAPAWR